MVVMVVRRRLQLPLERATGCPAKKTRLRSRPVGESFMISMTSLPSSCQASRMVEVRGEAGMTTVTTARELNAARPVWRRLPKKMLVLALDALRVARRRRVVARRVFMVKTDC